MSRANIDLQQRKLKNLLEKAPASAFLGMIWCADALVSGRSAAIGARFLYPNGADSPEPGSEYFFGRWELETLVNEYLVVKNISRKSSRKLNCKNWATFAEVRNRLHDLEDAQYSIDTTSANILSSMARLGWRQFPWQIGFVSAEAMYRSWFIYGGPETDTYFNEKYGLRIEEFTKLGFAAFACTVDFPAIRRETDASSIGFSRDKWLRFLDIVARELPEMRAHARQIRRRGSHVAYAPSALRAFPLIGLQTSGGMEYFAPLRDLLIARVTEGLYYDLVANGDARRAYAERFEHYVGELLKHYLRGKYKVWREVTYGGKKSPDVFLCQDELDVRAIVECKARRLTAKERESTEPQSVAGEAMRELAKGIVQIWRFHRDLRAGVVRHGLRASEEAVGMVVTLDPWMEMANPLLRSVRNLADQLATREGIQRLDRIPVSFVAIKDLERSMRSGLGAVLSQATRMHASDEFEGYQLSSVVKRAVETDGALSDTTPFPYRERLGDVSGWWRESLDRNLSE